MQPLPWIYSYFVYFRFFSYNFPICFFLSLFHAFFWNSFIRRFDESSSDKEILDLLLEKKRYDKRLLPPVNGEYV